MKRKTLSIDADLYRQLKQRQQKHETLSATLRRVMLADEKDPADYLEELAANPPLVDVVRLKQRQAQPARSARPAHWKRSHRAA
jgi:predicted CopG family antitoxin